MARAMKDSGIPWVGDIPESWNCKRIKYLASYNDEVLEESTSDDYEFSYIDIGSVEYGKGITQYQKMQFKDAPSRARRVVRRNDIIVSTVRTYLKAVATVPFSDVPQIASTGFIVLRAREDKVLPDFLKYAVLSDAFISLVEAKSVGISYPAINASEIVNLSIPTPSLLEQKRIANLLDTECERIDAVMEQTRASIEEYKKLKQSIITEAVTKGIRPNRPMKDSGIDWIGQIPSEWAVERIKNIVMQIESGVSVNAAIYPARENEIGVLKTSCVSKFCFLPNENKAVNEEELHRVACDVKENTIIMSRMNTPDLVGACGYVDKNYPNLFLPDRLWQIQFAKTTNVKYVWYYLNSKKVRSYYGSLAVGTSSSMQNISQDQFYHTYITSPRKEEQDAIVSYLDKKTDAIDSIIEQKEQFLSEMESYKKSLIFEYVTGKRSVNA